MSDLSESIESAMKLQTEADLETKNKWLHGGDIPGLDNHTNAMAKIHGMNIRVARRHFAGAPAWPNGEKALEDTLEFLTSRVVSTMIQCVANGMIVGENPSVWDTEDWDEYFMDAASCNAAHDVAVPMAKDPEVPFVVAGYFGEVMAVVSNNLCFTESEDQHKLKHIWDVWFQTLRTASVAFYICGVLIGRQKTEEAIFSLLKEVGSE